MTKHAPSSTINAATERIQHRSRNGLHSVVTPQDSKTGRNPRPFDAGCQYTTLISAIARTLRRAQAARRRAAGESGGARRYPDPVTVPCRPERDLVYQRCINPLSTTIRRRPSRVGRSPITPGEAHCATRNSIRQHRKHPLNGVFSDLGAGTRQTSTGARSLRHARLLMGEGPTRSCRRTCWGRRAYLGAKPSISRWIWHHSLNSGPDGGPAQRMCQHEPDSFFGTTSPLVRVGQIGVRRRFLTAQMSPPDARAATNTFNAARPTDANVRRGPKVRYRTEGDWRRLDPSPILQSEAGLPQIGL